MDGDRVVAAARIVTSVIAPWNVQVATPRSPLNAPTLENSDMTNGRIANSGTTYQSDAILVAALIIPPCHFVNWEKSPVAGTDHAKTTTIIERRNSADAV